MYKFFVEPSRSNLYVRFSTLALIGLTSCARADSPEIYVADPRLQNDFNTNLPATGSSLGFTYDIVQGVAVLEGDILLGDVDADGNLQGKFQSRGVGLTSLFNRWPDGKIIYEAPAISEHSAFLVVRIAEAIEHWKDNSRLEFIERTSENESQYPNYIKFTNSTGCGSFVGMQGGEQGIFLSNNCSTGSVVHEIGHAIGLFHEHTRTDRDSFITVDFNEISDGAENNFNRIDRGADTYGDYDYGSIMHYGTHFFSESGNPTIIVHDADVPEIGQREALSDIDIFSSNAMYGTDLLLGTPNTTLIGDRLDIDVSIFNMDTLGAINIELAMQAGEGVVWQVSQGSGWDCSTFSEGDELKCTLDSLIEGDEARLITSAQLGSASRDDLSMRLVSQTLDLRPSNNTFNDDGVEWSSLSYALSDDSPELGAASGTESEPEAEAPAPPPEETSSESNPEPSTASASESSGVSGGGGGSVNLSLLFLLLGWTGARAWVSNRKSIASNKA